LDLGLSRGCLVFALGLVRAGGGELGFEVVLDLLLARLLLFL
jgi:hypothetical protein